VDAPAAVTDKLQHYGLSKRESQVAALVFTGKTNQLIADTLSISRDTVKTHCKHIFGKLGISRRTEFLRVMDQG
jgi:DNA-binding CsgD family transcriptional regulator